MKSLSSAPKVYGGFRLVFKSKNLTDFRDKSAGSTQAQNGQTCLIQTMSVPDSQTIYTSKCVETNCSASKHITTKNPTHH